MHTAYISNVQPAHKSLNTPETRMQNHCMLSVAGTIFYRLGNPPPRFLSSSVLPPADLAGDVWLTYHSVAKEGEILAFDMYAAEGGAFTVSVGVGGSRLCKKWRINDDCEDGSGEWK